MLKIQKIYIGLKHQTGLEILQEILFSNSQILKGNYKQKIRVIYTPQILTTLNGAYLFFHWTTTHDFFYHWTFCINRFLKNKVEWIHPGGRHFILSYKSKKKLSLFLRLTLHPFKHWIQSRQWEMLLKRTKISLCTKAKRRSVYYFAIMWFNYVD